MPLSQRKIRYQKEVVPQLMKSLGMKNVMQVPRLEKIVLNMGMGAATQNSNLIKEAVSTLTAISGQKAVPTKAKKAISNFKLRAGMSIGAMVTLHGDRMWDFLDRLIDFALPRVKDFKGISVKGFDGSGNYTLGIKEQIIFLEVNYDKVSQIMGLGVCFVISSLSDNHSRKMLEIMGMPFRKAA